MNAGDPQQDLTWPLQYFSVAQILCFIRSWSLRQSHPLCWKHEEEENNNLCFEMCNFCIKQCWIIELRNKMSASVDLLWWSQTCQNLTDPLTIHINREHKSTSLVSACFLLPSEALSSHHSSTSNKVASPLLSWSQFIHTADKLHNWTRAAIDVNTLNIW